MRGILETMNLPDEDDCLVAIDSKEGGFRPTPPVTVPTRPPAYSDSESIDEITTVAGRRGGGGFALRRGGPNHHGRIRSKVGNRNHDFKVDSDDNNQD